MLTTSVVGLDGTHRRQPVANQHRLTDFGDTGSFAGHRITPPRLLDDTRFIQVGAIRAIGVLLFWISASGTKSTPIGHPQQPTANPKTGPGTITDLLAQGVPLEDVQQVAGHADPRTTRLYRPPAATGNANIVERISI